MRIMRFCFPFNNYNLIIQRMFAFVYAYILNLTGRFTHQKAKRLDCILFLNFLMREYL